MPQFLRSTRAVASISALLATMGPAAMLAAPAPAAAQSAAPVANFTAASTGVVGKPTRFDASSSTGTIVSYKWELVGSTVTFTGKTPSWSWTSIGTKTPKLTVTDSSGRTSTISKKITVTATAPAPAPTPTTTASTSPAPSAPGAMPSGLTVGIVPKLGRPVTDYFAYVNGTPPAGRAIRVGSDLGVPALRADLGARDAGSGGLWRNQVGGAKRTNGSVYKFTAGETAYNGVRIKLGPNTQTACGGFLALFNWTSFINGQGSGPFQLMEDGQTCGNKGIRFANSFGIANQFYGTGGHADYRSLPFPSKWMDVLVGVKYAQTWGGGWLELSWKWASEPVSAFRAVTFPVAGNPTRYITRTMGDTNSINDNRFGAYTNRAQNVQVGLAAFLVAPQKQTVLDAFTALGSAS